MIASVRTFLQNCPLLTGATLHVNDLGEDLGCAAVETLPTAPIRKRYVDGGEVRQYEFAISLRQACGEDAAANMMAASALEQIGSWIELQNSAGNLPQLKDGLVPQSIEVVEIGKPEEQTGTTAKYMLRCRLIYQQENGNGWEESRDEYCDRNGKTQ